jgi:regulatory protein
MKLPRKPKPLTPDRMANIAVYYLQRFAASEESLRRVLQNRMRRAALRDPVFAADFDKQKKLHLVIETIIEKHVKSGALNDKAYAEVKTLSLRRAGRSRRAIQQKLGQKGVKRDLITRALDEYDGDNDPEEIELKAAQSLARRRRFGPYRKTETDEDRHRKDVASMARAGFSFAIIKKVLGGEVEEE